MTYLLEVINLHKRFGSLEAVAGVSFGIRPGSCFGLLGPNGAGKTTTIEIIEGIKMATSGSILYRGKPRERNFFEQAGIQFQHTALMDHLTVDDVLTLFASFYPRTIPRDELVSLCQLADFQRREANKLSGGQKQRLLLALALINDPDIIFLDEPTTGLDPQSRRNFWQLINRIRGHGKTVVLTTHYMDEAESLCDELVIMDQGRIIAQGSPQALLAEHFPWRSVWLAHTDPACLAGLTGDMVYHPDGIEIRTASVESTLQELLARRIDLATLRVRIPTLEDLFIQLTGHALRD